MPPYDDSMLAVGTILQDKYQIEKYLSSGGFGHTYLVKHLALGSLMAVKEFFVKGINHREDDHLSVAVSNADNAALFREQMDKFRKEAQRLSTISHNNIVRVNDFFQDNNTAYYVMDYIEGMTLSQMMKEMECPFAEERVRTIAFQMLDALETIHSMNLWHMDIKPANIMIDKQGRCVLIDFGSSKQIDVTGGGNTSTAVSFTQGYAPGEQVNGTKSKWGPWTDIYALGATMYNLLTARKPPLLEDIIDNEPDAFQFPVFVSTSMRSLIEWMMTPSIARRPQSVDRVRQALADPAVIPHPDDIVISNSTQEETVSYNNTSAYYPQEQTQYQPRNHGQPPVNQPYAPPVGYYPNQPVQPAPWQPTQQTLPNRKKSRGWIIAVIALLLLAGAIFAVYYYMKPQTPSEVVTQAFDAMVNGNYQAYVDATDTPPDQKQMAVETLEKSIKSVKEGSSADAMRNMPKSINVLGENVSDTIAMVQVEVITEGGRASEGIVECRKIDGKWKISNGDALHTYLTKPGDVVKRAFNAMVNGDYKTYVEATNTPKEQQDLAVETLEKTMNSVKDKNDGSMPKTIEIINEDIRDTKATVSVRIITEGGNVSDTTVECEFIDGEWKLTDASSLQPET